MRRGTSVIAMLVALSQLLLLATVPTPAAAGDLLVSGTRVVSSVESWDDITIGETGRLVVTTGGVLNVVSIEGSPGSVLEVRGGSIVMRNIDWGGDVGIHGRFWHLNITDGSILSMTGQNANPQITGPGPHDALIPESQGGDAVLDVTASRGIRLENCTVNLKGGRGFDLPPSTATSINAWTTGPLAGWCAAGGNATLSLRTTGSASVHIEGLDLDLTAGDGGRAADGGDCNSDVGGAGGGYSDGGTVGGEVGTGGDAMLTIDSSSVSIVGSDIKCTGGRGGDAGDGGSTQSASNGGGGGGGYSGGDGGNKSRVGADGGVVSGRTGSGGEAVVTVNGDSVDVVQLDLQCTGGIGGRAGDAGTSHTTGDAGGGGGYGGGGGGGYRYDGGRGLVRGSVATGGRASVDFAATWLNLSGCDLISMGGSGGRAGAGGQSCYGGGGGGGYGGGGGGGAYGGDGGAGEVRDSVGSGGSATITLDGVDVDLDLTRLVGGGGDGGQAGDGGDAQSGLAGCAGGGGGAGYAGGGGAGGNSQSGYWGRKGGDGTVAGPVGSGGDVTLGLLGDRLVMKGITVDLSGGDGGDAGTGGSDYPGSLGGGGGGGGYGGAGGASNTADNVGGDCHITGSVGHGGKVTVDWPDRPPSVSITCSFHTFQGAAGDGTASPGGGGVHGGEGAGASTVAGTVNAPVPMSVGRLQAPANGTLVKTGDVFPTLDWSLLHASTTNGDVADYVLELDDAMDFADPMVSEATVIPHYTYGTSLPLGNYYWRVMARYETPPNATAGWSDVWVIRVAETVKPVSQVQPLPAISNSTVLTLTATAEDEGSGVLEVELWYSMDDGPWRLYGTDASTPIAWEFDTGATGGDGRYEFYSRARDVALNLEDAPSGNDTFTLVDTTAPVSSLEPLPTYTTRRTVDISANATDLNGVAGVEVWYRRDEGPWKVCDAAPTPPYRLTVDTSGTGGDGRYEFYSRARDVAGNLEDAPTTNDTWTIVDTTAPVSSVHPLPAFATTDTITVNATASDRSGVERVELWYRRNGGEWTRLSDDSSPPLEWTVDLSSIGGDGVYEFATRAWDVAGNREGAPTAYGAQTILDTEPPVSSVDELPAYSTEATLDIAVTAFDEVEVVSVELWYGRDDGEWTRYGSPASAPFRWSFDTSSAGGDGAYRFYSVALDIGGHAEGPPTSPDATTTVDTHAPASQVTALPDHEIDMTFEVRADASDAGGVEAVELWYKKDGGAWTRYGEARSPPAVWQFDAASTGGDGRYLFYSVALDLAGNRETAPSQEDTLTVVDTIGPTISVLSPADRSTVHSSSLTVSCVATDASGLARVDARIDGEDYVEMDALGNCTFKRVGDGWHTITVRATDVYGNTRKTTMEVRVDAGGTASVSSLLLVAVLVLVLVAAVVGLLLWRTLRSPDRRM